MEQQTSSGTLQVLVPVIKVSDSIAPSSLIGLDGSTAEVVLFIRGATPVPNHLKEDALRYLLTTISKKKTNLNNHLLTGDVLKARLESSTVPFSYKEHFWNTSLPFAIYFR